MWGLASGTRAKGAAEGFELLRPSKAAAEGFEVLRPSKAAAGVWRIPAQNVPRSSVEAQQKQLVGPRAVPWPKQAGRLRKLLRRVLRF